MKKRKKSNLLIWLLIISFFVIGPKKTYARNCPSNINSNLHEINDYVEFGDELRLFYFGIDNNGTFESSYLSGLKLLLNIYPTENLAIVGEIDLRYKNTGWYDDISKDFKFRLNQAFLEYDNGNFSITPGIQFFTFSSAAVLDQRFMGLSAGYNNPYLELNLFAGTTKKDMMKSSINCLWQRYNDENDSWRIISGNMKNIAAGLSLSVKKLNPYFLQSLFLLSKTEIEQQKSLSFSIAGGGPIIKRKLSFTGDLIAFWNYDNYFLPGVVVQITGSPFGYDMPILKTGVAKSFRYTDQYRLSPVFENLTWGIIKRYSIHNNNIVYSELDWQINDKIKPYVHYYYQTDDFNNGKKSNETDAGFILRVFDKYSFNVAYVGLDLFDNKRLQNAFYFETRLIF